jgi:Na+/phosphate symporter
MKDQRYFWNPLRIVSPKLDKEVKRIEELHEIPVSDAHQPQENLVLMVSKLIHMTRMLSGCLKTDNLAAIDSCERLAEEIHRHEKLATSGLLDQASGIGKNVFQIVVRFPSRMERIGRMFEAMLRCSRIKATEGIPFSEKAQEDLSTIFDVVLDMLENLRDALVVPNKVVLEHIKSQGQKLVALVEDARLAHWKRLEAGFCSRQASPLFVEILDAVKHVNEYIAKMNESLVDLANLEPISA